ncbi:MAG TPA: aminopeptidase N C-terminal domain-containing protein [Halomonas sp.]|nr:aminopeptidase N C-terminal domain-containing protein [Halomonas sp.]
MRGTAARVRALIQHPAFDLKNPNRVYALICGFCGANPRHFHAADGSGYALAADVISELQAMNPQVASRIARSFDRWRQFDAGRQGMHAPRWSASPLSRAWPRMWRKWWGMR